MSDRMLLIDAVRAPRFLYGTAWKEGETRRLTELAIGKISTSLTFNSSRTRLSRSKTWQRPDAARFFAEIDRAHGTSRSFGTFAVKVRFWLGCR